MTLTPEAHKAAKEKLIVALDVPDVEKAKSIIEELGDEVIFYKIGLRLLVQGGPDLAAHMREKKKNFFLDYKFHDIGAQVGWAAESAARLGGSLLTVHSSHDGMVAAVKARNEANAGKKGNDRLRVVAVTVLTSSDENNLWAEGISGTVEENVIKRALAAERAGCDGVVASANEVRLIRRKITDPNFLIVTPGIRLEGSDNNDQKRVATPFDAIKNGASLLVVGRPITNADDRVAAARKIVEEIARAIEDVDGGQAEIKPDLSLSKDAIKGATERSKLKPAHNSESQCSAL
jgi:orotidine-5'-phosphate decarboxylase